MLPVTFQISLSLELPTLDWSLITSEVNIKKNQVFYGNQSKDGPNYYKSEIFGGDLQDRVYFEWFRFFFQKRSLLGSFMNFSESKPERILGL